MFQPTKDGEPLPVWYAVLPLGDGRKTRKTGFRSKRAARNWLKDEWKRLHRGEIAPAGAERLTVEDLLATYYENLQERGKKAIRSAYLRIEILKRILGPFRASEITFEHLHDFRKQRKAEETKPGDLTIDRDLQLLRAAFRLALKQGRLRRIPYFPITGRDDPRQGFFEPTEADHVQAKLEGVHADIFRFARFSGWRIGEVLPLRWEWIDRQAHEVRLPTSKNGKPRSLLLFGQLWGVIERRWAQRAYGTRNRGTGLSAFVFHFRMGRPVGYKFFRDTFAEACTAAKVSGKRLHDLRRSAARELRRAGVAESVCMSVTGHKTRAMFDRYAITDGRDQAEALKAREALLALERVNFGSTTEFPASQEGSNSNN